MEAGELVRDLAFSANLAPDGRLLATAYVGTTTVLRGAETGELARTLAGHTRTVMCAGRPAPRVCWDNP